MKDDVNREELPFLVRSQEEAEQCAAVWSAIMNALADLTDRRDDIKGDHFLAALATCAGRAMADDITDITPEIFMRGVQTAMDHKKSQMN